MPAPPGRRPPAPLRAGCAGAPAPSEPIGLFACVTPRGSTYDVTFGYVNENPVAVSIPVGLSNGCAPGASRPRPTRPLRPRHTPSAFAMKGIPSARTVVWRVAHNGTKLLVVSATHPLRCGGPTAIQPVQVFALCALKRGNTYVAAFGYLNPAPRRSALGVVRKTLLVQRHSAATSRRCSFRAHSDCLCGTRRSPRSKVTWTVETNGATDTATASSLLPTVAQSQSAVATSRSRRSRRPFRSRSVVGSILHRRPQRGTSAAARVIVVDLQRATESM